jgi:hypothetical protein
MLLLGDEAQVNAHFSPFGYYANFYARLVHSLRQMLHYAWKSFRTHLTVLLGDEAEVEARFGPFGHPMELLGDMGHVESHIVAFVDGVSVGVRCTVCAKLTIGSKIILDTPDGTHRCHESCGISHRSIWRWC